MAIFSKMSLMNEFLRAWGGVTRQQGVGGAVRGAARCGGARENTHMMDMALEEMPVSGCTCFSTL